MKKTIFYIPLLLAALFFGSCESDYVPAYQSVPLGGFVRWNTEAELINFQFDLLQESNPVFEAPIIAPGDNVASYKLTFMLVTASGSFGPFDLLELRELPAMLTFSAQDVAAAAGLSLEELKGRIDLDAKVTREDGTLFTYDDFTGDLKNPGERQAMRFSVGILCPSDLAGTFDYVHTNMVTGPGGGPCVESTLTGTVTLTEISPGVYSIDDGTFGQYPNCWADTPAVGITVIDACDLISTGGADQYGLLYTYHIISVNGPKLTLEWENNYGDGGTVVLTRQDGRDWPRLAS